MMGQRAKSGIGLGGRSCFSLMHMIDITWNEREHESTRTGTDAGHDSIIFCSPPNTK